MQVKIEKLDNFGRGIAYIDNKITFIENALPKEEVEIILTNQTKKYNEGKVENYITLSDKRRDTPCPYYNICNGCNLMHMPYLEQLTFKKEKVESILKKYANIDISISIEPSKEFNYRNKITLHKKNDKLGYMNKDKVIEIEQCLIADNNINDYLNTINKNEINEDLIIRSNGKEVISNIKENYLYEKINDYKFRIDIKSFFQVNNEICSKIFEFIENNIDETSTALDLYSGVSTLGIIASKKAKKVYSIEENKNSYLNAIINKKINNVNNIELINNKVEKEISKIKEKVDLIITDPPRSGMDKLTIDTILHMKPKKVIYMSCDVMTLARDLKLLSSDYNIEKIKAFDMFPNTYHCESVVILEKIK